jgi:adenosylhomocysteine nucleosidase
MFALRRESMFFRHACRLLHRVPGAPCASWLAELSGRPLVMVETGVGQASVDSALDWLSTLPGPRFLVYAGFAGALDPSLQVGDVLVADAVIDTRSRTWPTSWRPRDAVSLVAAPLAIRCGRLLTATQLVASPEQKQTLAALHKALAVDMEAAYIAARCTERAIPFGCVRSISDRADTSLSPSLVGILGGGRVRPGRLFATIAGQPRVVAELWRLGRDTRHAARQLAMALAWLLQ